MTKNVERKPAASPEKKKNIFPSCKIMNTTGENPTIIIGAGPAGLATAGRLREAGEDFIILEKSQQVGYMWHCHYDRLCLHTVKQLSHLPGLEFPEAYPTYVTRAQLCDYFTEYARHFNIKPIFGIDITSIEPASLHKWSVADTKGQNWQSNNVVICTGLNRVPNVPNWDNQDSFAGTIEHSRTYKNADKYRMKKVLVVGMGNTGAEIALDLAEQEVDVSISVRSAVNIIPRDINGRPTQLTGKQLEKLPFGLGDWLGNQIRRLVVGDLSKYGLETKKISPLQQLKETGMTPVIDLGTVKEIKKGTIKILPEIKTFADDAISFSDGTSHAFDAVILATGYHANLTDFIADIEPIMDRYQLPNTASPGGHLGGLHFVGFDNYKLGGLLGTIFTDSLTVCNSISDGPAVTRT